MREGLMEAWRQRATAQRNRRGELSAQALVGFLTLLLIIVLAYWSASPDSASRMASLQQLSAQAFNLQVPLVQPEEPVTPPRLWQMDALAGIDGIHIERVESTLSVMIENDILFFPGTADTRESVVLWWQRLVQGLTELNHPLKLSYVQQWHGRYPDPGDRRILAEQAVMLGRLLTAEQLTVEQFDMVDTWVNPYFEGSGVTNDETDPSEAVLLVIEVRLASPDEQ